MILICFPLFFCAQVWFQNRRMKDKRQRIAIAWPYAAIYSDPTMAASILQACANSVGMAPYGAYGPHAQLMPQMPVMSPQMPANHFAYSPYRYAPYPIPPPQRTPGATQQNSAQYPLLNGSLTGSNQMNYGPITIPKPQCTPPDILQSPTSQHSGLSLSPGSDKDLHHSGKYSSSSNDNSPVKSLASTPQGLLMTAPQSSPSHTILPGTPEKPKLFKPYKSEA